VLKQLLPTTRFKNEIARIGADPGFERGGSIPSNLTSNLLPPYPPPSLCPSPILLSHLFPLNRGVLPRKILKFYIAVGEF